MRELQQVYEAYGESALSANLRRHIDLEQRRRVKKGAGKAHGSTAWSELFEEVGQGDQRQMVQAAVARKTELGWIRRPRETQQQQWVASQQQQGEGQNHSVAGPPAQQQQQGQRAARHSKQQGQAAAAAAEADSLQQFDFSAAVAGVQSETAAAHRQSKGRRRRQELQQG
jgi:hypothetical protein